MTEHLNNRQDVALRPRAAAGPNDDPLALQTLFDTAPVGLGLLDRDLRYTQINEALAAINGVGPADTLGRTVRDVLPDIADRLEPFFQSVLASGEPVLNVEVSGETAAAPRLQRDWLANYYPVRARDGEVVGIGLVVLEITERKRAERRLSVQHAVTRVLAEATALADAAQGILQAVCDTLGWEAGEIWEVDERERVLRCIDLWASPRAGLEEFQLLARRITFRSGEGMPGRVWEAAEPLWIPDFAESPAFPRADAAGRAGVHGAFGVPIALGAEILGVLMFFSRDVEEPDEALMRTMTSVGGQLGQFMDRKRREAADEARDARMRAILESALECVISIDHEGKIVEFNPAAERTFGYARDEVLGQEMASLIIPPALRAEHREGLARYLATGAGPLLGRRVEVPAVRADGSEFPAEVAITRVGMPGPPLFTGYLRDITERKHAQAMLEEHLTREKDARAEAEAVGERLAFLSEASALLASTLDYETTLASLAQLAVPTLADWCVVDVLEDGGSLRRLALAHVDPSKVALARELERRYPADPSADRGVTKVVRSGQPEVVAEIPDSLLAESARDAEHLAILRELGLRSYMSVPLTARGRTLGAITFVSAESGRRYGRADLSLAEELSRRASVAVDNARLYDEAEKRAQAAQVLETVADGVFLVDGDGTITLWNPAAAAITGLTAESVLGRRAEDAIPGWRAVAERIPLQASGEPIHSPGETVPVQLGDRELWLSLTGVAFAGGTVYAFRDLTEERALDELKSELISTVSHELRTPLAAVYGAALTLQRADLELEEEQRRRLLGVISSESERLSHIVDDVLLASRLESGTLQLSIEQCDGAELAARVVDAARAQLGEDVSIGLSAPSSLPALAADPNKVAQVLTNLVDNAVKYSPDGGQVAVALEQHNHHVRFSVRDEGLGIPPTEQQRIFEKFYRLDPNLTRGVGGTGLGLYISRELVYRMGGRMWVSSELGEGSTFYFELPAAAG